MGGSATQGVMRWRTARLPVTAADSPILTPVLFNPETYWTPDNGGQWLSPYKERMIEVAPATAIALGIWGTATGDTDREVDLEMLRLMYPNKVGTSQTGSGGVAIPGPVQQLFRRRFLLSPIANQWTTAGKPFRDWPEGTYVGVASVEAVAGTDYDTNLLILQPNLEGTPLGGFPVFSATSGSSYVMFQFHSLGADVTSVGLAWHGVSREGAV